jgi:hypothetical protein
VISFNRSCVTGIDGSIFELAHCPKICLGTTEHIRKWDKLFRTCWVASAEYRKTLKFKKKRSLEGKKRVIQCCYSALFFGLRWTKELRGIRFVGAPHSQTRFVHAAVSESACSSLSESYPGKRFTVVGRSNRSECLFVFLSSIQKELLSPRTGLLIYNY